jgi:protease-4
MTLLRTAALRVLFSIMLFALTGCSPVMFTIGGDPQDNELRVKVVEKGGSARIAIIDVSGTIFNANKKGLFGRGENPVSLLQEQLNAAREDSSVKAIILRLNTPGGTVNASEVMYGEVMRFKKETHKPVIALMMDLTASGGYYVSCSADEIVAHPTTITGSIGVIVQTFSIKPMLNHWGVETEAIKSGPNKDVGSPLSIMTPDHRAVLKALVDRFYARFTAIVRASRPKIRAEDFARVTDGRVLCGDDALEAGLVDRLGDLHDAVDVAKARAHIKSADLIVYHRPSHYAGSAYADTSVPPANGTTQINLAQLNITELEDMGAGAGFYYMWIPQP